MTDDQAEYAEWHNQKAKEYPHLWPTNPAKFDTHETMQRRHNVLVLHRQHLDWSITRLAKECYMSNSSVSLWLRHDRFVSMAKSVTAA